MGLKLKNPFKKGVVKQAIKDAGKSIKSETKKAATNIKTTTQKEAAKVKKTVKNIKKEIKKIVPLTAKDIQFIPLYPFKKIMTDALDKKGIGHTPYMYDIAPKFLNTIVKKNHFQDTAQGFYNGNNGTLIDEEHYNIVGDVIEIGKEIIPPIIKWFKELKKKKDAGETLTPDEEVALGQAEELADAIVDSDEIQTGTSISDFIFSWKGGLLLIVIVGLFMLAKKKS